MKKLIINVMLDGSICNILVENGIFADCNVPADSPLCDAERASELGVERIDAAGKAILPAFYNTHNHAAMTLLRGYGDDNNLERWLTKYIWPYEAKLTPQDIRRGSEWAIEEMAQTGTVFFNDMYFDIDETIDVARRVGMRFCAGITIMDMHTPEQHKAKVELIRNWKNLADGTITAAVAPHAVYTVGPDNLKEAAALAREAGMKLHIHLSETATEVENCKKQYGLSPVRHLERLGVLGPNVIAAHCVHVDEEEWDIFAKYGVVVAHCPCSNMKLASGRFPYELAIKSGIKITLATDGVSSNNNLDMREEMKFAALLAKVAGDPEILPAAEILKWATVNGAEAFGINGGIIENGRVADAILVDLSNRAFRAGHSLVSDWVYAADSSAICEVMCNGKIIYKR